MGTDRESDRRTRDRRVRPRAKPERCGFADSAGPDRSGTPPARCLNEPRMQTPISDVLPLDPVPAPIVQPPLPAVRVIAIASGKGGVGKTNVTANLAVLLARRGLRVWVLDADLGLANLDIVYGVRPAHTLESVLSG